MKRLYGSVHAGWVKYLDVTEAPVIYVNKLFFKLQYYVYIYYLIILVNDYNKKINEFMVYVHMSAYRI